MKLDLHMHSKYSDDGEFTPKELIQKAKEKELDIVALSDHNIGEGIDEMIEEGSKVGIQVIPAIECDTKFEGYEIHVLAYNIDYKNEYFKNLKQKISAILMTSTKERFEMFEKLFDIELDVDRLVDLCRPSGILGAGVENMLDDPRYLHVKAFDPFRKGGSKSGARAANFYWEFCFKGAPCYIDVAYPSLKDTVDEIHKAGGIAVIAHPWKAFYERDDLLQKALNSGIDGIEAYSNYHEEEHNAYYVNYCKENNCLLTCGSDFHGKTKPTVVMGEFGYPTNDYDDVIIDFLNCMNQV